MNANAVRHEPIDASAGWPEPLRRAERDTPSTREIDAYARGSGVQARAPGRSVDEPPPADVATVGALMAFVERAIVAGSSDPYERKMARCLRVGDYDGALVAASVVAYRDARHWRARRVKTLCAQLTNTARVGARSSPRAVLTMVEEWDIHALYPLTQEQAYMLRLIDGIATVSDVLDASPFSPELAASTLASLLAAHLIVVRA